MRIFITIVLGLIIVGTGIAQDANAEDTERTLIELLASEELLAYRRNPDSDMLEVKLLSDELISESRVYYANRVENLEEYHRLQKQRRFLEQERLAREARNQPERPNRAELMDALEKRVQQVSRPTGHFRVGEVTQVGADFIGLQELGSSRGMLIHVCQMKHVIMRPTEADPPGDTNSATGPKGSSLPPSR